MYSRLSSRPHLHYTKKELIIITLFVKAFKFRSPLLLPPRPSPSSPAIPPVVRITRSPSLIFSYYLDLVCLNLDQDKFISEVKCYDAFSDDHDEVTIVDADSNGMRSICKHYL